MLYIIKGSGDVGSVLSVYWERYMCFSFDSSSFAGGIIADRKTRNACCAFWFNAITPNL